MIAIAAITAVLICRLNQPTNFPFVTKQIMYGVAPETGARAMFLSHGNTFLYKVTVSS
jgi:hypothetical protein